jgi:hypothetical protein
MKFFKNDGYEAKSPVQRHVLRGQQSKANIQKVNYLITPANQNGTTTSPCKAKIQRIGLLNITCVLKVWKHVKTLVAFIILNKKGKFQNYV